MLSWGRTKSSCWMRQVWSGFVVSSTENDVQTTDYHGQHRTCGKDKHVHTFSIIHLNLLWISEYNPYKTDPSIKPILQQILIFIYSSPTPFESRDETRHLVTPDIRILPAMFIYVKLKSVGWMPRSSLYWPAYLTRPLKTGLFPGSSRPLLSLCQSQSLKRQWGAGKGFFLLKVVPSLMITESFHPLSGLID